MSSSRHSRAAVQRVRAALGQQLSGDFARSFSFASAVDADMTGGEITLSELHGKLLGAELSGSFSARKASRRQPRAQGAFAARGPDLPALINANRVLTGDGFAVTGRARLANLHDATLQYDRALGLSATRSATADRHSVLGAYRIPITCRGQFAPLSCWPDAGAILAQVVMGAAPGALEQASGDHLKDALQGKRGDALKNLLNF